MNDTEKADGEKLNQALEYFNNGELSEAEQMLMDVAAHSPVKYEREFVVGDTLYIRGGLVDLLTASGREDKDHYLFIVCLSAVYPDACYYLGFIYIETKRFALAVQWLEKGRAMEPASPKILIELGAAYNGLGDHERALACYQEVLNATTHVSKNDNALALRGMGFQLIELNRLDEAKKSFRKSLELKPDNAVARNELAYIAMIESGGDVTLRPERDYAIRYITTIAGKRIDVSTLWFYGLLQTQTPNGWFTLTEKLAENVGRSLEDLRNIAALIEGVKKESTREIILATATAILVLQVKAAEYKEQWSEKVKKANKILNKDAKNARLNGRPVMERAQEIFFPKNISGLH